MSKQQSKLQGANIFEHMNHVREVQHQTWQYFHYDSKLWRAIKHHLETDNVLVDHPASLKVYRGTGPGITFLEAYPHNPNFRPNGDVIPAPEFTVAVEIHYVDEEESSEFSRKYRFSVPVKLELEFSQETFQTWIDSLRTNKKAIGAKEAEETLLKIAQDHPEVLKNYMKKCVKAILEPKKK